MRTLGHVVVFVVLVLSVHWTIFRLNPGIADVRTEVPVRASLPR